MELLHQTEDIIVQRYRILHPLGQGGIATTYAAEDLHTLQRVALKELSLRRIGDWKVLELFEREAKVLSQINHPRIPRYIDYFQIDTPQDLRFYLVQELASGRSLSSLIENNWHPSEAEVRHLAAQVLEILVYLHALTPPVIHRDVKPQNLILREDGQLFLVDFGAVQDTLIHTFSRGSTVVGTYGYMAPEQFRGQAYPATDLYGLGATLLFLLTHQSPVDLPHHRLKIDFHSQVAISPEFADWLETLLEPVPEDRFLSATEALAALNNPSTLQKQNPLAGSRIIFKKTAQKLLVEIPAEGWQFNDVSWLGFALLWSGLLFFWTAGAIALNAHLFFRLLLIPFWLIALAIIATSATGFLFRLAGCTRLEIDRKTFRFQWQLFGISRQIQGQTADIKGVEMNRDRHQKELVLIEGIHIHHFAAGLSPSEKEWLVAEIASFLRKPLN